MIKYIKKNLPSLQVIAGNGNTLSIYILLLIYHLTKHNNYF